MRTRILSMQMLILAPMFSGLIACQSTTETVVNATQQARTSVEVATSETGSGLGDALKSPLEDLNLTRAPIPEILSRYVSPYDLVPDVTCAGISAEVSDLSEVLGPDSDQDGVQASTGEKVGGVVSQATLGAVEGATSSFIPFSGIVRSVSGASEYERRYNQAYKIGFERRAFLKGIGQTKGCEAPAAPAVRDAA